MRGAIRTPAIPAISPEIAKVAAATIIVFAPMHSAISGSEAVAIPTLPNNVHRRTSSSATTMTAATAIARICCAVSRAPPI